MTKKLAEYLIEEFDKDQIKKKIKDLFSGEKPPKDFEVHKTAEEFKIEPDKLEEMIYQMLFDYVKRIGKHRNVPDDKFKKDELEAGIKIEQEHTGDKDLAKEIAKDHLMELPDYYTRLKKMENESLNEDERLKFDDIQTGMVIKLRGEEEMGPLLVKRKEFENTGDYVGKTGVFLRSRYHETFWVSKEDFDKKPFEKTGLEAMMMEFPEDGGD